MSAPSFTIYVTFCASNTLFIKLGEEGNGTPLQYSCLGNPMDRGTQWATVHGVAKNWTQQSLHTQHALHAGKDGAAQVELLHGGKK